LKRFRSAKPLTEPQVREMIDAHMVAHGVVVCPPAYLAPTTALDLTALRKKKPAKKKPAKR
jgi:hypothetical protein